MPKKMTYYLIAISSFNKKGKIKKKKKKRREKPTTGRKREWEKEYLGFEVLFGSGVKRGEVKVRVFDFCVWLVGLPDMFDESSHSCVRRGVVSCVTPATCLCLFGGNFEGIFMTGRSGRLRRLYKFGVYGIWSLDRWTNDPRFDKWILITRLF